jgi:hypothetical protein
MITYADLYLGLLNYVKNVDPDMPMFVRGTPTPAYEGKNEWFSFEILSFMESPARRHTIDMTVDIQLVCYTRHATHRTDNDFTALYKLMDKYAPLFHQKDVIIKNTCIQFKENRIVPLDLRSVGDYAKDILNQLPPLHTLSTVILNQGLISSSDVK